MSVTGRRIERACRELAELDPENRYLAEVRRWLEAGGLSTCTNQDIDIARGLILEILTFERSEPQEAELEFGKVDG